MQNAAVGLARSQRSFIIQGPPGTGKSQTITNLIADYAGRGKRVLFVCEKRAALDVVFHRLKQSGLDPLCCLIHDSQTDKKAFIADLRACYRAVDRPAARRRRGRGAPGTGGRCPGGAAAAYRPLRVGDGGRARGAGR
ncbi:AAA domain-containing protein [Cupriavidus basilensis]